MNPQALAHRARRHGWDVQTIPQSSGPVIVLQRNGWDLEVAFEGCSPKAATVHEPGHNDGRRVRLRSINDFVQSSPEQIGHVTRATIG
ncbi:hypothetical protein EDD27_0679 [Nonomuraea polychroma]|uniref:Uncharacterized protein n=1 Tax=Nonomuraea polychroma TaxID=46176 RepID=A0A438LYQ1_9ACTN|nr:hypothetical protein [Nonomuraea polychroma]RVX38378.1 hypothetical protein EDD27_0679 [Nonomuraea polychroma]